MKQSIGQIIKQLRKERGFTQEELAELLNISAQSVSKWENDTCMPDISLIVPLASVFGVTTDTLFGVQGISDEEAVDGILREVESMRTDPEDREFYSRGYEILREGLNQYPNNVRLLVECLKFGRSLACTQNGIYYDPENGERIYRECVRMADLIESYAKRPIDILWMHRDMVLLHSSYGNEEAAKEHVEQFPWDCSMTAAAMNAYIAHNKKDYELEGVYCEHEVVSHLCVLLDNIVQRGWTYEMRKQYEEALECYFTALRLIDLLLENEDVRPPVHHTGMGGDIYVRIAGVYLNTGRKEEALDSLEKMVNYDMEVAVPRAFREKENLRSTLMKHINLPFPDYQFDYGYAKRLQNKLNAPEFDSIRDEPRFQELLKRIG